MVVVDPCAPKPVAISPWEVAGQFRRDVVDKEVQSAATYSYLWSADQMGHVALGLLVVFLWSWALQFMPPPQTWEWVISSTEWLRARGPLELSGVGLFFWEFMSFLIFATNGNKVFRLDFTLLALNALTAFFYMFLGCVAGSMLQIDLTTGAKATGISAFLGLLMAWPWLRQKMVWQKAGLPFLSRLSHMDVARESPLATRAPEIDGFIARLSRGERNSVPKAIIVTGPLGAGKTTLACGIGTECALKSIKVRYTTFDKLGQMIAAGHDDAGPENIGYWPWRESEVLIIDDIDSGVQSQPYVDADEFATILNNDFRSAAACIADRITVWVLGQKDPAELQKWTASIADLLGLQPGRGEVSVLTYQPDRETASAGQISASPTWAGRQPAPLGGHIMVVPLEPAPMPSASVRRLSLWPRKPAAPTKTPTRDAA